MLRHLTLSAALLVGATLSQPATAAQISVIVSATAVKPVVLAKLQDLNFGTLTFSGFTGTRIVTMSRAGTVTCSADIVCSGTSQAARFNVQGTNRMFIQIVVSSSTLSNGADTINFTADAPANLTLTNSGAPGSDFEVGGSITVIPTLTGGIYTGTMNVTADNV